MAYLRTAPILTSIREVLGRSAGVLRTVPAGRFSGDLPAGLSEDTAALRAHVAPRFEAHITEARPASATPPRGGSLAIWQLAVEVRVLRTITPVEQLDDEARDALHALAVEDADVIAQALGFPGNLAATIDGERTDLVSECLTYVSGRGATLRQLEQGAQLLETIHELTGLALSRPATS